MHVKYIYVYTSNNKYALRATFSFSDVYEKVY